MDLREYDRIKFELSALLRAISQRTARRDGQHPKPLQDLFARLAEDRFNIAMVGRFSRGKTSLLNALLGMDRLPTGVVPLTSVTTRVSYGSEANVVLNYHGSSLFLDIPLDQLADYITERGNPGNRRGISVADLQLRRSCCGVASRSSTRRGSAPPSWRTRGRRRRSCRTPTR